MHHVVNDRHSASRLPARRRTFAFVLFRLLYPQSAIEYDRNCLASAEKLTGSQLKAKFHYAIQVADLVSDLASDKFVRVCNQL